MTLSELEQWLWGAAHILKGPVDAADYKAYIFPLLFFKRISDVYDEEFQQALEESDGDVEYAALEEMHRFVIPDGAHWKNVREASSNVGQVLQNAFREIEKTNPEQLYGIFGDINWSNKDRLPDSLLKDLIEHFSAKSLGNSEVGNDILGQSYEYLIKKFADMSNKAAGEFYTPRSVVHMMVKILQPQEGERIYDPACGTGGMLLEAINYIKEHNGDARNIAIYGQEKNLTTSTIARINFFLHGVEDSNIVRGDTLRNPAFLEGNGIQKFDMVLANPPFSLDNWGEEYFAQDPYGRNIGGTPPKSNADFAWVQHMISSMKEGTGRMAIVLPHGALFRSGKEAKVRQKLIELDLLDTVIGLGDNLFYGTNISTAVLIFNKNKTSVKSNHVHFIDASDQLKKGRAQNFFLEEHANQIVEWFDHYEEIDNISAIVSTEEISKNGYNLNISRYVKKASMEEIIDLNGAIEELKMAKNDYCVTQKLMQDQLFKIGIEL